MSKLVNLVSYRSKKRKAYLARHGARIDRIITKFVQTQVDVTIQELARHYQAGSLARYEDAWDYVHFREVLAEILDQAIGRALFEILRAQRWFDHRMVSQEEVVERALRSYIQDQCQVAQSAP